jgi:hypothetical protein
MLQKSYVGIKPSKTIAENAMLSSNSLTVLVSPNVAEAEKTIRDAVSQRKTLLIIGNCWVHYLGRAR